MRIERRITKGKGLVGLALVVENTMESTDIDLLFGKPDNGESKKAFSRLSENGSEHYIYLINEDPTPPTTPNKGAYTTTTRTVVLTECECEALVDIINDAMPNRFLEMTTADSLASVLNKLRAAPIGELQAVGYRHALTHPLQPTKVCLTETPENPWGKPGEDYNEIATYTCRPVWAAAINETLRSS